MTPELFKTKKGQILCIGILGFQVPVCFCFANGYWDKAETTDCLETIRLLAAHSGPGIAREQPSQTARPCAL